MNTANQISWGHASECWTYTCMFDSELTTRLWHRKCPWINRWGHPTQKKVPQTHSLAFVQIHSIWIWPIVLNNHTVKFLEGFNAATQKLQHWGNSIDHGSLCFSAIGIKKDFLSCLIHFSLGFHILEFVVLFTCAVYPHRYIFILETTLVKISLPDDI